MIKLKKIVELPLVSPLYSTHHNGIGTACLEKNPSVRNWYLNNTIMLSCARKFLGTFSTPDVRILNASFFDNPYIEKILIPMKCLKGCLHKTIKNLLDDGYYVHFTGVDDYFIEGKSFYKTRHFNHDGTICGYNQNDNTYCIYAYDSNWIYQKFWVSQKCFDKGRKYMNNQGIYGYICGIKPVEEKVEFSPKEAYRSILEYLDSDLEKFPKNEWGMVYGIIVQEYVAEYIERLYNGIIPYEKIDRRVFRIIWEHKKVMLERIEAIEEALGLDNTYSSKYKPLIAIADDIRMLFASYQIKRRDSLLPTIKNKTREIMNTERIILREFADKIGELISK